MSEASRFVSTKKKKQGWSVRWLDVEGFKPWLKLDYVNHLNVFCTICKDPPGMSLRARFHIVKRHGQSYEHYTRLGFCEKPLDELFALPSKQKSPEILKKARAKLIAAATSIGAKFSPGSVNYVAESMAHINQDTTSTLANMRMGKTQTRDMIVNVISESIHKELAMHLKHNLFTASIDESTDRSNDKTFAITVKFPDFNLRKFRNVLYDLPLVFKIGEAASATASVLFARLMESFESYNIPPNNCYALSFDNCSTMAGARAGVKALAERKINGIITVGCTAHKTALCLKRSKEELPDAVFEFIQQINGMLSSSHRKHDFEEMQRLLDEKIKKMINYKEVRWLSLENVVLRILEKWEALYNFAHKLYKEKDTTGSKVFIEMSKVDIKCYFLLLKKVLHELNSLNRLFQRQDIVIHTLQSEIEKRYKNIVSIILDLDYVRNTPAAEIDIFDISKYVCGKHFNIDDEVRDNLNLYGNALSGFCERAFNFVLATADQIELRFFNHRLYKLIGCLDPSKATSLSYHNSNPQVMNELIDLCSIITGINSVRYDTQSILEQWQLLPNSVMPVEENFSAEDFWMGMRLDNEGFEDLSEFALYALGIPHSNVAPEVQFSLQNNAKRSNKASMNNDTLNGTLKTRQMLREHPYPQKWEPTPDMVEKVARGKFYKKNNNNNK